MTWEEALVYLSGDGVAVAVAAIVAVLAEYWPWYAEQESRIKQAIFFGLALAVPLLASAVGVLTADWPASWEATFWPALRAGLAAGGVGTFVHRAHVRLRERRGA